MKKEKKNCCGDCKNGKTGKNHACQARIMMEQLKKQHNATKNLVL